MKGWQVKEGCGVCHGFVAGAECQRRLEDQDPRLTPEQLCVMGLVETIERNHENQYTRTMSHAWSCLELSLASSGSYRRFAEEKMNEAFSTLDTIIRDPEGTSNIVETLEAVALKNFEGLFRARATGRPITPDLMKQTRDNIGAMICTIDEIEDAPPQYDGYVSGFTAEQIICWLTLYTGDPANAIYPTSHREGRSEQRRLNHDSYMLRGDTKIPVEVKRRHRRTKKRNQPRYDKPIIKVVLQDILDQTASVHGGTKSRRDNFLIDYIRFDLSGRASRTKERVLKTASDRLLAYIDQSLAED